MSKVIFLSPSFFSHHVNSFIHVLKHSQAQINIQWKTERKTGRERGTESFNQNLNGIVWTCLWRRMLKHEISGTSVRTTNESGMTSFYFFCRVTILKRQKDRGRVPPLWSNYLKRIHWKRLFSFIKVLFLMEYWYKEPVLSLHLCGTDDCNGTPTQNTKTATTLTSSSQPHYKLSSMGILAWKMYRTNQSMFSWISQLLSRQIKSWTLFVKTEIQLRIITSKNDAKG